MVCLSRKNSYNTFCNHKRRTGSPISTPVSVYSINSLSTNDFFNRATLEGTPRSKDSRTSFSLKPLFTPYKIAQRKFS